MFGGALGSYFISLGATLYWYQNPNRFFSLLAFPFCMLGGALVGLVIGSLTLLLEDLIEEELSVLPRTIVTAVIAVLMMVACAYFVDHVGRQVLKQLILPGVALGAAVGLVARSRLRAAYELIHGLIEPSSLQRAPISNVVRFAGGIALRLVSTIGLLMSLLSLACFWNEGGTDEIMVIVFAIYYFACTVWVSFRFQNWGYIAASGTFLNGMLLLLAVYWDPSAKEGQPGALMLVLVVLSFLWLLFTLGQMGLAEESAPDPSEARKMKNRLFDI
jgi:hypothetical protein